MLSVEEEKRRAYRDWMLKREIRPGSSLPPLWRLLWKLGATLPPPHFMRFLPLVLICGGLFGTFWGLAMFFLVWRAQGMPLPFVFASSLLSALLFGLVMAFVFRRQARRLKLTTWQDWHSDAN